MTFMLIVYKVYQILPVQQSPADCNKTYIISAIYFVTWIFNAH